MNATPEPVVDVQRAPLQRMFNGLPLSLFIQKRESADISPA